MTEKEIPLWFDQKEVGTVSVSESPFGIVAHCRIPVEPGSDVARLLAEGVTQGLSLSPSQPAERARPESYFGTWPDFDIERNNRTLTEEDIRNRFGFHKGTVEGPNATAPRHAYLRVQFMEFVDMLDRVIPAGRAKSVALTELETAAMWAHKAIAELAPVEEG